MMILKKHHALNAKKKVTEDIIARGIMQGIDKMMKAKENDKLKDKGSSSQE